jgi:L-asparaginase
LKRVAIVFTGGTISMQPDPEAGGNRPVLNGAAILARSPEVASIADVEAIDWGLIPASHLRFEQLLDIARTVDGQLSRPEISGVVVVQGTDTIEETAFAFDLLLQTDKPVVVTGAMRDAASPEYDGPRNLADAVACAVSPALTDSGVVVVLGGAIIAADDAVKSHTTALDAFRPRDGHPLGQMKDGAPVIRRRRLRRRTLPRIPPNAVEDVYLVTAVTGMDGALIRGLAPLKPRCLVVAATGTGNTHPDLLAAARELMEGGTIVALTTRSSHGKVDPIYAFPGGGATWQRAGAILSRFDGPKTRVALALGLASGLDHVSLAELVALPQQRPK